ncbi:MAG: lysozyme inhibitor LprI family protein [Alphaproteobacteria bacterium]
MTRRCLSLLLFFCCGAYAVSSAAKASPSFDCVKAKNEVERLICADEDLAKLDVEMNKSYHAFMKTLDESYYRNKLKRKQIDWLGYREKLSCFNTDDVKKVTCLKNAYQRRIENLNAWAARQNYDFFIDYPDYYEQSKRVGYRKRMGKFISKLGEEYYIECKKRYNYSQVS